MLSLDALLNALDTNGMKRQKRNIMIARLVITVTIVLALLVYAAVMAYDIWHAWQTAYWSDIGISVTISLFPLFLAVFFAVLLLLAPASQRGLLAAPNPEQLADGARVLREAAAAGDERVAPLATLQPALLLPEDIPASPLRIGPLKRPFARQSSALLWLTITPLMLLLIFLPALISLPFTLAGSFFFGGSFDVFSWLPLLFLLLFLPVLLGLVLALRGRRFTVTTDEQGVRWRGPGRRGTETQLRWDQVRSLYRVGALISTGVAERSSYVLESDDTSLTWVVASGAGPDEFAASEALLRLAATKAGKPLRDLTAISRELIMAGGNALRLWATRIPAGAVERARPSGPLLGMQLARNARPKRRGYISVILIVLVSLLLVGATFGAQSYLQQYQPRYFATLPTLLSAEHPLFQDSLSANDGTWAIKQPSADDVTGYGFAQGGYQLYGGKGGASVESYAPGTYGDAAVEVTATQTGTPTSSDSDGVGLVLHGDALTTNFIMFQVRLTGKWEMWSYHYVDADPNDNWNFLDSGHSTAIQTAAGSSNRLLVVMRGGIYLFFVNDQFVGSHSDRYAYERLPTSGYVGVFLNDSAMVGTFTNFAVYPVKSPPALEYV